MRPVTAEAMPDYDPLTHKVTTATTPTRGVVRLMTEADATDPITEEVNTDLCRYAYLWQRLGANTHGG